MCRLAIALFARMKKYKQEGSWALDRSPESLSEGMMYLPQNINSILQHLSLSWVYSDHNQSLSSH